MSNKHIILKATSFLLISLMVMLIANKAVFTHVHKLSDGSIIEHAHPFDKSEDSAPIKAHQHTNAELFFFQNLNTLSLLVFLTFAFISSFKIATQSVYIFNRYILNYISLLRGRSPPKYNLY